MKAGHLSLIFKAAKTRIRSELQIRRVHRSLVKDCDCNRRSLSLNMKSKYSLYNLRRGEVFQLGFLNFLTHLIACHQSPAMSTVTKTTHSRHSPAFAPMLCSLGLSRAHQLVHVWCHFWQPLRLYGKQVLHVEEALDSRLHLPECQEGWLSAIQQRACVNPQPWRLTCSCKPVS